MVERAHHYLHGEWGAGAGGRLFAVSDPATGAPVSEAVAATASEVDAACDEAARASDAWARTSPAERAACVRAAATRLASDAHRLSAVTTAEMGRPAELARGGVAAAVSSIEQYAELGPLHRGRSLQGGWDAVDLMVHEPRGSAAVITPWNDPVAVPAALLGAALVTGNTVVFKPSERTPLTGELVARAFLDELPADALTVVQGDGEVGALLASDPRIDVICHVGSTAAGRAIAAAAAVTGAKALLENGGKDPLLVDADVDPAWAAAQTALGGFINSGQLCTAVERVYVHELVAEEFVAALVKEAEALVMGPGADARSTLGPLIDERARVAVHQQVLQAQAAGARTATGGFLPEGPGAFYPATVLTDVTPDMAVVREETFGPVIPVLTVGSFEEGLELARASDYGLAAVVLTASMQHAQQAWRRLRAGTVKVNAVFGGAPGGAAQPRGASGDGFGYGPELLDELTVTKVVHLGPAVPGRNGSRP